jgi:hypothetical protein
MSNQAIIKDSDMPLDRFLGVAIRLSLCRLHPLP